MRPNIFEIATKELSHDAFIAWALEWGDKGASAEGADLHSFGSAFAAALIKKKIPDFNDKIESVKVERQWNHIDVTAVVNGKYFIAVEDKIDADHGNDQLKRYREIVDAHCKTNQLEPVCVYLKTGNEGRESLKSVTEANFFTYMRPELLSLLNKYSAKNDIYTDFKQYLLRVDATYGEWKTKKIKDWQYHDWIGFYSFIEDSFEYFNWGYANNPKGGVWFAVCCERSYGGHPLYLQISERDLCFKMAVEDRKDAVINKEHSRYVLECAKKHNLSAVKKPRRLAQGTFMTVAFVESADWLGKEDEVINIDKVLANLRAYEKFLVGISTKITGEHL